MTYEQLLGELKQKKFKPIYFFHGDEPYYIDRLSDYIINNALTEAEKSFNQTIVYGKDCDAAQVTNLAKRFPMMASHQVVVVKEAQDLKDFKELIHYVEHPQPSTILLLNYKYKNPDKRLNVFKALNKNALVFQSKKLYDNQVPGWISAYLSGRKYQAEPKAVALLAEFLGNDLSRVANELDKLMVAVGDEQKKITPVHVEENIGISKDYNQFELQNALGNRDVVKANRIIGYFARNEKNYPLVMTISSLYYYFSKLLLIHYAPDKSVDGLTPLLKTNRYFVKDYMAAARRYSAGKLVGIISLLREYDMRSKGWEGNSVPDGELMKELTFKILHS